MSRWLPLIIVLVLLLLAVGLISSCARLFLSGSDLTQKKGDVAVITLKGEIYNPRPLIRQLEKLAEKEDIKAIVFRINSPGGTVSASEEIHGAVARLAKKKKVVASLGTVAASGGYYVACGAEKIIANYGTITGSIGVRMSHVNVKGLLDWIRVEPRVLTSGRMKDLASPFRAMTKEEEEVLQEVLQEMHGQFKRVVGEARGLDSMQVEAIADGRIFTGEKALSLGLVDQLGSLQDAIEVAAKLGGVEGKPEVIYIKKGSSHWLQYFIDEMAQRIAAALQGIPDQSFAFWRM